MSVNICFISGHYFGFRALMGLLQSEDFAKGMFNFSLLVTLDSTKKHFVVGFHDFCDLASNYSIPQVITSTIKTKRIAQSIKAASPDYILIIGWSELAPPIILDIPKVVNHSEVRNSKTHGCLGRMHT
jgi:methionyl-tRNA formyltransferase